MKSTWRLFTGNGASSTVNLKLPAPPPWRHFDGAPIDRAIAPAQKRAHFLAEPEEIELVNAALYLRRPLLVTGRPGIGKSSLVYAVAEELGLGEVLVWPINTRSTLQEALYRYDAIGRLQDKELKDKERSENIGKYVKLGPLGTALVPSKRPRALLIDEIDKSDIDLPNDLLNVFEQATFEIPELSRIAEVQQTVDVQAYDGGTVAIQQGRVTAHEFPFVVMTSNGERDFPAPFLRRCIRLEMKPPTEEKLARIVAEHLGPDASTGAAELIREFFNRSQSNDLATDQLLNAVFLLTRHSVDLGAEKDPLYSSLLKALR